MGLTLAVALLLGALTSVGQSQLPGAVAPVANSAGSWCLVAFGLAWPQRGRRTAAVVGSLALLALLVGYDVTSVVRGFAVSPAYQVFWVLAAVTVGPVLGLGARAIADRWTPYDILGAGVLAGVLAGEGAYYLTVVADTTSPVWGIGELVLAAAGPLVPWRTGRLTARGLGASYLLALVVAALFVVAYRALDPTQTSGTTH